MGGSFAIRVRGCSSELRIPSNRCAVVLWRWNVVSEGRNTPAVGRLPTAVLRGNSGASGGQVEKGWAWGRSWARAKLPQWFAVAGMWWCGESMAA